MFKSLCPLLVRGTTVSKLIDCVQISLSFASQPLLVRGMTVLKLQDSQPAPRMGEQTREWGEIRKLPVQMLELICEA